MGWDKKQSCTFKKSITRNSFTPSHWQKDVQLFPSWEDQEHNRKCLTFPLHSLSFYHRVWHHMVWNTILHSSGPFWWHLVSKFSRIPSLPTRGKWRKALVLWNWCLETGKRLAGYQHINQIQYNIWDDMSCVTRFFRLQLYGSAPTSFFSLLPMLHIFCTDIWSMTPNINWGTNYGNLPISLCS